MSTVKDYLVQIDRFQKVIDNERNHLLYPGEDVVKVPMKDYYDMLTATGFVIEMLRNTKVDSSDNVLIIKED